MFSYDPGPHAGPESGPLWIGGNREAALQEGMQPGQAIPLTATTLTASQMAFNRAGLPRAQGAVHMALETATIPKTSETWHGQEYTSKALTARRP